MYAHRLFRSLFGSCLLLLRIILIVWIIFLSLISPPLPFDLRSPRGFSLQQRQFAALHAFAVLKVVSLQAQVDQLKFYNSLSFTTFNARLAISQRRMSGSATVPTLLMLLHQLDQESQSVHTALLKNRVLYTLHLFHTEVTTWARAHPYHDDYDDHDYAPDNAYMFPGLGSLLDHCTTGWAYTPADLLACLSSAQHALFFLHMFEADYQDLTPYDQSHATDLRLLAHEHLLRSQAMVVSLAEQVMRVYLNGRLLRTFYVTTGRADLPSLPGTWPILDRRSSLVFVSADLPGSPHWFPETPIQYALLYHEGGYFVHDAPWRGRFGPGTQFPHFDPQGTTPFNFDGSHGCVNLRAQDAFWLYLHTNWRTAVVIY